MIKYYLFLLLIAPLSLIAQTPKNIEVAGTKKFTLNDEVKTILDRTDIYLMASFSEGINNSVLEAMSMEIPILSSNIGPDNCC